MSAVGFGSKFDFFASTTRNEMSALSGLAKHSAMSRATSYNHLIHLLIFVNLLNVIENEYDIGIKLPDGAFLPLYFHPLVISVDRLRGPQFRRQHHAPDRCKICNLISIRSSFYYQFRAYMNIDDSGQWMLCIRTTFDCNS